MSTKKLDVKEALNASPQSFTKKLDTVCDDHLLSDTRKGEQPDPIALILLKAGGKKQ